MKSSPASAKPLVSAVVAAAAAAFTAADAANLSELPVNRWTTLYSGDAVVRVHPRLVWLPEQKRGFMWLNLNYHARAISFEDHAQSRFFVPDQGTWQSKPASFAPNDRISPAVVGHSCLYLPGLKKVLLLLPHDRYSRGTEAMRKALRGRLLPGVVSENLQQRIDVVGRDRARAVSGRPLVGQAR